MGSLDISRDRCSPAHNGPRESAAVSPYAEAATWVRCAIGVNSFMRRL